MSYRGRSQSYLKDNWDIQLYINSLVTWTKSLDFLKDNLLESLEERDNGSSPVSIKEIELLVKALSVKKGPGWDGFIGKVCQRKNSK